MRLFDYYHEIIVWCVDPEHSAAYLLWSSPTWLKGKKTKRKETTGAIQHRRQPQTKSPIHAPHAHACTHILYDNTRTRNATHQHDSINWFYQFGRRGTFCCTINIRGGRCSFDYRASICIDRCTNSSNTQTTLTGMPERYLVVVGENLFLPSFAKNCTIISASLNLGYHRWQVFRTWEHWLRTCTNEFFLAGVLDISREQRHSTRIFLSM